MARAKDDSPFEVVAVELELPSGPPGAPYSGWTRHVPQMERMSPICAVSLRAANRVVRAARSTQIPNQQDVDWEARQVAVVSGSTYGSHATDEIYYRSLLSTGSTAANLLAASPRLFAYTLPSAPAGEVSIYYGFQGPVLTVVSGQTAGLDALGAGLRMLRRRRASHVMVLAAEVSSPFLTEIEGSQVKEGATAVLLTGQPLRPEEARAGREASLGYLVDYVTAFYADEPAKAMRQIIEASLTRRPQLSLYCCDARAAAVAQLPCEPLVTLDETSYPEQLGSLGAGIALKTVCQSGLDKALIVSCDDRGHASGVTWLKRLS